MGLFLVTFVLAGSPIAEAQESAPLDTIEKSAREKKFTGSPITLKLKDADINEVMRLIGEASGFNVVVAPGVSGKVTVSLEDVPWDQALDVVMTTMNLAAERFESVLRVMPREVLLKEKQAILETERIASQAAPRITRIFPISYSDLTQLSNLLSGFLSTPPGGAGASGGAQTGAPGAAGSPGQAGGGAALSSIQIDQNTQSLIVRDTSEGVERIRKMIALLDVQTPQIMIEAKVIDANESFVNTIDGKFGITAGGSSISINGASLGGGASSAVSSGSSAAASADNGPNSFRIGIGNAFSLNAILNYSEAENTAKVITSPRLMVLSGKKANINQANNLSVQQQTVVNGVTLNQTVFIPYNTSLDVTPRATNEGSVFMKLNFQRDVVQLDANGQNSVAPRSVTTEVVVENGNTLVLGGVQSSSEASGSRGFPFLRKIPILGWLFGTESRAAEKNELMFFVTPKIVNVRKTALGSGSDSDAEQKSEKL